MNYCLFDLQLPFILNLLSFQPDNEQFKVHPQ